MIKLAQLVAVIVLACVLALFVGDVGPPWFP